jgi:hypothetical protein
MKQRLLAIVVASGDPVQFSEWLSRSWQNLQSAELLLIPWGRNHSEVADLAPRSAKVIESNDQTLEGNRNAAIRVISEDPSSLIAFVDDDAYLDEAWQSAIEEAANQNSDAGAFASQVRSIGTDSIQGRGHVLTDGAPHDRGHNGVNPSASVLTPCFNSGVVRWSSLERVLAVDEEPWDPRFRQWQTCFDFGLKLKLTGCESIEARGAGVQHGGYMTWTPERRRADAERAACGQIRSRLLLYDKFFDGDVKQALDQAFDERVARWRVSGYPGFKEFIKGEHVDQVVRAARADLAKMPRTGEQWKERMMSRPDVWDIAGLTPH